MTKKYILGNWKMHKTSSEVDNFLSSFNCNATEAVFGIAPQAIHLERCIQNKKNLLIGSQNCSFALEGAHTGELSPKALIDLNCDFALIGHSERRALYLEDDALINKKIKTCLDLKLLPILCIGENLDENEAGTTFKVIESQLKTALVDLPIGHQDEIVIAYEPVWAIGTGKTATPEQANSVHQHIRKILTNLYGDTGSQISILYGGSVKPENIENLLAMDSIDGALVGGASLKPDSFTKLCEATR